MDPLVNACIIGLGRAGKFHLSTLNRLNQVELTHVVEPNPSAKDRQALEAAQVNIVPELELALNDERLDMVIVASPTTFHFDHITRSLQAQKHVFAEKPMGKSVREINQCYDLALEQNKCLYLGFQRRYDHNFLALKNSITEIGPIRTIKSSSRDNPSPTIEFLKMSGNIFHDMLIHDFDMLIHLLGPRIPETIYVMGHAYDAQIEALEDYDTILVTLQYPEGLLCSIDTSRTSVYGYDQRIELFGANGMAQAENQRENTLQISTAKGTLKQPIDYSFPERYKASYFQEVSHFIEGIQKQQYNNVSKEECILSHLLVEAAHESILKNQPINFTAYYQSYTQQKDLT